MSKGLFEEPRIFLVLIGFLIFLALVFNLDLALLYGFMLTAVIIIWLIPEFRPTNLINSVKGNTKEAFLKGLMYQFIFFAIIYAIGFVVKLQVFESFGTFLDAQSAAFIGAAQSPAFAESSILTILSFGFLIPIIETLFIVSVMYVIIKSLNINTDLRNPWIYVVFTFLASVALWFHATAKGVDNNFGLASTFVFFFLTCFFALRDRESESVVHFHIINNTTGTIKMLLNAGRVLIP